MQSAFVTTDQLTMSTSILILQINFRIADVFIVRAQLGWRGLDGALDYKLCE